MQERLEQIKQLLAHTPFAAIATVNEDGSPHNTPVFATFNDKLHMFWASSPDSLHSRNIVRDGRVFIVLFNLEHGGGLYIAGRAEQLDDRAHINYAYTLMADAKRRFHGEMAEPGVYAGQGPQRLYRATAETVWVNQPHRDENGVITHNERVQVALGDVLP